MATNKALIDLSRSLGYIDFWGFHPPSTGWFLCGWLALSENDARRLKFATPKLEASFETGTMNASGLLVWLKRADVGVDGVGIILHAAALGRFHGRLRSAELQIGEKTLTFEVPDAAVQVSETDLVNRLRGLLGDCFAGHRQELTALLARRGYAGAETVSRLSHAVRIGIDEVILCKPDGVVLIGWCLADPAALASIRLCAGPEAATFDLSCAIRIERADVAETIGRELGLIDSWCGFVAFLPITAAPQDVLYLQVDTAGHEVGYLPLRPRQLRGMAAIRRILDGLDVHYAAVRPALDHVIGPAVQRLNAERLRTRPTVTALAFGAGPDKPSCSVIVPLYGRIDFLEYQLALFSAFPEAATWELIYVLDDPARLGETERLAESAHARFALPLKLLLLGQNQGFAPACNIGLAHARANTICFLNSDVFPRSGDWLERLCADLEEDASLGAVGGLLLFENGAVQHEGMALEPVMALGGFRYPLHTRKGWRPRRDVGLEYADLITGACMVMPRGLALRLGGFDERYVVGDFEDCDLCERVRAEGRRCAVDHRVEMFHLERRSQVSPDNRWRRNLTLHNAWEFDRRWPAAEARGGG